MKKKEIKIDARLKGRIIACLKNIGRHEWCVANNVSNDVMVYSDARWGKLHDAEHEFVEKHYSLKALHKLGWEGLHGSHPKLGIITLGRLNDLFESVRMTRLIPSPKPDNTIPIG